MTVMIPIYMWEFVMIYGERIPIVKNDEFFINYGFYFDWKLKHDIPEQMLYFVILTLFCMTISCFKLTFA